MATEKERIRSSSTPEQEKLAPTIGARLRHLREQKGLSVTEVSEKTHISCSNIHAIENETFEKLPADTFVRGLVTLYGDFLESNGSDMAVIFLEERDQNQARGKRKRFFRNNNSLAPKRLAEPSHISSATLAAVLLLIIVFSFTSFCAYTGWNPFEYFLKESRPAVIPLSETIAQEPAHNTTSAAAAFPADSARPSKQRQKPYTLTAVFTKNTGVDVVIDGKKPVHLQGTEGKELRWKAGKSIRLYFDQPDSATITVNETQVAFPARNKNGRLTLAIPNILPGN